MAPDTSFIVICSNPQCRQKLRVPKERLGRVTCPKCRTSFDFASEQRQPRNDEVENIISQLVTSDDNWLMPSEIVLCQNCERKNPAGVHVCWHCGGRKLAMYYEVRLMMEAARRLNDRASLYFKSKKVSDAAGVVWDALRFNPYNAMAHNNMGGMLILNGRIEECIEYMERTLILDPTIETADHYLTRALGSRCENKEWLRCYGFQALFAFGDEKTSSEALDILPDQIRERLSESPVFQAKHGNSISSRVSSRLLARKWSSVSKSWNDLFVVEIAADPLTKAEIWATVLGLRSAGMRDSINAMLRMTSEEIKRLLAFFEPKRLASHVPILDGDLDLSQSDIPRKNDLLIVVGPKAKEWLDTFLAQHDDVEGYVFAATTAEEACVFVIRGTLSRWIRYICDFPQATEQVRREIAARILERLKSYDSWEFLSGEVRFEVNVENSNLSLTVTTKAIGGREARHVIYDIESAFLAEYHNC